MRFPSRAKQRGFTLIELLIVIAIIGLIAAMLIPNLLDAMQKAKQKRTIADMRIVGTAMFSWLTDQVGAAAAGAASTASLDMASYGSAKEASDLQTVLVPQYLQVVPVLDGWKSHYEYYLNTQQLLAKHVMAIRSAGRDLTSSTEVYTVTGFDPTDYNQDVIWADGFFVRWPERPAP
jgi:prepilin-type N-terminal cleavage/methylation domain-containing protein